MGVFGDWANRYFESGFSVIPVKGKKAFLPDWSKYCHTTASETELADMVLKYSDCNIGLCLGKASGVIAIDVDSDDPNIIKIVNEILPPTPCVKRGRKGFTSFYRFLDQKSKTIRSNGVQVIDVLCDGRQTVLPPSHHPDTNEPYLWTGPVSLLDVGDDLPSLFSERLDLLAKALEGVFISKESKSFAGGRNDSLKAYVCALADKHSVNEIVEMALNYDSTIFESNRLFTDKSEFKSEDAFSNAFDFVTNILKSVIRMKQSRGEAVVLGSSNPNNLWPSREAGFHEPAERGGWKPMYEDLAKYLVTELGFVACDGSNYLYNGKNHEYCSDARLKSLVGGLLKNRYTPTKCAQFCDAAKTFSYKSGFDSSQTKGFINLSNGVLNISERRLEPHSMKRFFRYHLATSYDSSAECPRWLEFLDFVFQGNKELVEASQEIFGYCLEGGTPWLHKAILLYGDGRNGKSTWLDALTALVGNENCSAVPLSSLVKPFSVIMADGKLVNAVSEGESRDLSSEVFKAACSGESVIAAHKGKPEFPMPWTARMIISLNTLPNFRDASAGNTERIYILPFNRYIKPEERDPNVRDRLLAELPGILNWSLVGLERLRARKRLLVLDSQHDAIEEYKENADTVYEWFKEFVIPSEGENVVRLGSYYRHYVSWVEDAGRYPVHKAIFCKNLSRQIKNRYVVSSLTRSGGKLALNVNCKVIAKSFELLA